MIPERVRPILEETRPLAERFAAAGRRLYLVGGIVRDLLLDRDLARTDLDFTTDARPEETRAIAGPLADAIWDQGERFGTIGVQHGGRTWEITTHRAEAYDPSLPQADRHLRRPRRGRPRPPRLHRQRHGPHASRTRCSSIRTKASPTCSSTTVCALRSRRRSPSATTRCG